MQILFGHQRFGAQAIGGITRYFVELATALNSLDLVRAQVFSPLYVSELLDPHLLSWPGGRRVKHFTGAGPVLSAANLAVAKLLLRRRSGIDVYHETYYSRFDCAPRGAVRVVTVFDMIHELRPADFPALDRTIQLKARSIQRADHIICISRNTQVDLVRMLGVSEDRTSVVHLGSSLAPPIASQSQETRECPYLLHVGQRSGYKNFERMLRAYAASPILRASFCVLCFGGGGPTHAELDLFRQLGLDEQAVQYRSGPDGELAAAYANAAMLVYPSQYEGFGLPPLEAMSLGCPVVCSNASSIPEVVGEAGQYFDPMQVDSIRQAMEDVAQSSSRRTELIALGIQRSRDFTWKACAENTLKTYDKLLGRNRAPSVS